MRAIQKVLATIFSTLGVIAFMGAMLGATHQYFICMIGFAISAAINAELRAEEKSQKKISDRKF